MNSSYDDEFAPNPFTDNSNPLQQGNDGFYNAGSSGNNNNAMSGSNQPDPFSGMTGTMDIPESPPHQHPNTGYPQSSSMQQQPPSSPQDPMKWSGAMDQRAAPTENYGGTTNVNQGPPQPQGSIFGWRNCLSCFQMSSYFQYFDVETQDIVDRLKASILQFHLPDQFRTSVVGDYKTETLKGPDLYGPVWISFTLIFIMAVTSNIHAYWAHKRMEKAATGDDPTAVVEEFDVDIHLLLHASSVVLTFVFVVSTALWLGTNCMGMPGISWAMWVCCYGYSQVPYMAASILIAILPFEIVSWPALGAATGASALLVLRNLSTPLLAQDSAGHAKAAPFIFCILGCHAIYFFWVKIQFFA